MFADPDPIPDPGPDKKTDHQNLNLFNPDPDSLFRIIYP